jgi:S-DNA-T family DNA segregation ATPase FtsK/SpoIIIE
VSKVDRYAEARALVIGADKASTSFIQRKLYMPYNEAAGYVARMEREGFVSAPYSTGIRTVLVHSLQPLAQRERDGVK